MKREKILEKIAEGDRLWDVAVVGGGATGLGVAVDAALRGYSVVLFERDDFAKCTSSRSTKLVHGGVRYLAQGDVKMVLEALHERGLLRKNAPHLVKDQSFVIANYSWWDNFLYTCGLTLYDVLSWGLSLGRSRFISKKKVQAYLPNAIRKGLKGGVVYHDGQFDDSRLAVNLAQSCAELGGCPLNYMNVTEVLHDAAGKVSGVRATDRESGRTYDIKARCVVNAAGVFVDDLMRLDTPAMKPMVRPSQGTHLVVDRRFLPGDYAVMIPKTSDGRVLFAIPWHGKAVIGTTDLPRERPEAEPRPLEEEIDFILGTAARYMDPFPGRGDVLSAFAGQRPLAAANGDGKSTKELSRNHKIIVSEHNLLTVTGGKWTTYRRMAQDTLDKAIELGLLESRPCRTASFRIHGYRPSPDLSNPRYVYGSDEPALLALTAENEAYAERISDKYAYTVAEVVWAVRHEMARTVEDVLGRRVRLLFVDAREASKAAPLVARVMASELGHDAAWIDRQVREFQQLASRYYLDA